MAAYDYRCRACGDTFEVRRSVTSEAGEVTCPAGHTDVTRLWSAASVGGTVAAPRGAGGGCCGGGCCG